MGPHRQGGEHYVLTDADCGLDGGGNAQTAEKPPYSLPTRRYFEPSFISGRLIQ